MQSIFEMQLTFSHILNSVEHVEENVKTQCSRSEKLNHKKAYSMKVVTFNTWHHVSGPEPPITPNVT